jgi:hypothetical protein
MFETYFTVAEIRQKISLYASRKDRCMSDPASALCHP